MLLSPRKEVLVGKKEVSAETGMPSVVIPYITEIAWMENWAAMEL